ncbi:MULTISPECIES: toll/interleukin-1 receptor domain-containing protein [unclassified Variovorax]|uniref:toll/interleukin-1 receptor domain-containing protein n=1 Tax=unclassified Variovorax TaxID=663243 RepID=UPI001BD665A2|nr:MULTISPECIES: toll/interleukin-1 receptor domain-containing protein [unclassified Variovorax]
MSHSHADKAFVRRLSVDLGALGAHVWLDEAELMVGDSLFEKIEAAIDQVDHLVVFIVSAKELPLERLPLLVGAAASLHFALSIGRK